MNTKKDKTREMIIEKAYSLFSKNGFSKITMKDICDITKLSRGGLYSHFSSTAKIFEAILDKLNTKQEMNFYEEMEKNISAKDILNKALDLLNKEMKEPNDSLSLAMYEYALDIDSNKMEYYNKLGKQKWTDLINYGIKKKEFKNVNVEEIVNVILYAYQGVRMWSRIIQVNNETCASITNNIRRQLLKEE